MKPKDYFTPDQQKQIVDAIEQVAKILHPEIIIKATRQKQKET